MSHFYLDTKNLNSGSKKIANCAFKCHDFNPELLLLIRNLNTFYKKLHLRIVSLIKKYHARFESIILNRAGIKKHRSFLVHDIIDGN